VWAAEIERRLAKIDAGQAKMLPMDDAVARLHRAARPPDRATNALGSGTRW
jgi:hypothetical protein